MLDDICPVQFIEGVNEGARVDEEQYINTKDYSGVAIQFKPKLSYCLTKLDIYLTDQAPVEGNKYKAALCSDYKNNPSDVILSSGEWIRKEVFGEWQEVELTPAVVIRNKAYWVTIDVDRGSIGLPITTGEEACPLRFRGERIWKLHHHDGFKTVKVMLRFYGRIVPIIS